MKMHHHLYQSAFLVAAAIAAPHHAQASDFEGPIDFNRVNASLSRALDEFNATSTNVDITYSFDPALTSVEQDRYQFQWQLSLTQAPGQDIPLLAYGTTGIQVHTGSQKSHDREREITLSVDAVYQTDVLALLKQKAAKASHCDQLTSGKGLKTVIMTRHCEYVGRLAQVTTIAELQNLLVAKIAAHRADVGSYVETLRSSLATAPIAVADLVKKEIKQAKKVSEFLNSVAIKKTVEGFVIQTAEFDGCPMLGLNGLKLHIEPATLAIQGSIDIKTGKNLYLSKKPVIVELLRQLEDGVPSAMALVRKDAEGVARLLTHMM